MSFDFMTIPAITILCLLIGQGVKVTPLDTKFIPAICGFSGAIIGILAYFINMPAMLDLAEDGITATAIGAFSGLAATGLHQVYKQLTKKEEPFEDGDLE